MNRLFDKTTEGLAASINFRLMRNNITAANIANAETPNYKAKKVDFEKALSRALDIEGLSQASTSHADHQAVGADGVSGVRVDVYDNPEGNLSNDKNTVDLEKEMAKLAENTILYKAALQLINKKLGALKYAATNGGR
ncbi:MAG: flagellar basal body rod protein FlgB [Bdellovibrionaceae bacterium]|jgi:flagellar basal-body rod protein FlgB|nr:flagellar basal body rod protein FlgB [Pseudobdellovibrionaceae bacterium]